MYRRGYFRQRIDHSGWQQEYWVLTDPERLPAALVTGEDGEPLKLQVDCADDKVENGNKGRKENGRGLIVRSYSLE